MVERAVLNLNAEMIPPTFGFAAPDRHAAWQTGATIQVEEVALAFVREGELPRMRAIAPALPLAAAAFQKAIVPLAAVAFAASSCVSTLSDRHDLLLWQS
jgi:hypothetical protein